MKVIKAVSKTIFISFFSAVIFSCGSVPNDISDTEDFIEKQKNTEKEDEVVFIEPTEAEKFIDSLQNITLHIENYPAAVNVKRSFAKPFTVSVKNSDGEPISSYSIDISYPSAKNKNEIEFSTVTLTTKDDGTASFTAPQTSFAARSKVTFYPTPFDSSEEVMNAVSEKSVSADYLVKSDIISKGAVLFIWDYNENNRPVNNSYDVQAEFRSRGITMVGNGPVNETSYIGKPQTLYRETYEIIGGNAYGYLIYGTVKFEKPVTANADKTGYTCVLKSEIAAVSMKNGEKLYDSVITYESEGKNWNECVSKGKSKLAELIVNDILYSL